MENMPVSFIERKIFVIRGHKVMIDAHLASLYEVETKVLKRAVNRNLDRFPSDFMFELTLDEYKSLRCQIGTSNVGRGGHRYLPYAFTEQGVSMLSSVLNSKRAIRVNIQIMRAFVRLKELMTGNEELKRKIKALERRSNKKFAIVFHAIEQLLDGPKKPVRVKGFNLLKES